MAPRTRYARSGDLSIAYQVVGDGPVDLVHAPPFISHLEWTWEWPPYARYLRRLASFSRLILFDKRGTGLSDRTAGFAPLAERMDDVRAVMDAVGSRRAVICGVSESAPLACLFAATYPERAAALILLGAYASEVRQPDYPWPPTAEEYAAELDELAVTIHETWGNSPGIDHSVAAMAPSLAGDAAFCSWFGTFHRLGASPGAALDLARMNASIDVRHILPAIRVPTLVLHRAGDQKSGVEQSRYVAAHIPGARLVELPGIDYLQFVGDADAVVDEIEAFVTGVRPEIAIDHVLATILTIDVADAAGRVVALGDQRWADLQERFRTVAGRELGHFRGRTLELNGTRIVAAFDVPVRAIRCAQAIGDAAHDLGLATRTGLHTGECEVRDERLTGLAVSLAGWLADRAAADEILVSSVVKDLAVGTDIRFADRGSRSLAGVSSELRLFAVISDDAAETAVTSRAPLTSPVAPRGTLTRREQEVMPLVARGLSNRQIADALHIGERTVESHVASILAKCGLTSCAQLAAATTSGALSSPGGQAHPRS
jgi:pimeloyl-ACP methyl ester carboxylesterase/class 3 adenylate cyclase/DNA-binding CsgD family transcriptional regulator